ncbi:MAG: hypothetical protein M0R77_17690 [Gammaproteobacteria bacterium]|nr:hypothetical protein [Gammaproteobacteria bacterium]
MRLYEFGVGKIVKGVNTTVDVGVDEISKQSKKFGNKVDKNGNPPINPGGKIDLHEAVDYKWTYDTSAKFKVGNMDYNVDFLPMNGGDDDDYNLEFSAVHGPRFSNSGMMGQSSIQVFGTVIQIAKDFINREHPNKIEFTADKDENRIDLYTKLINRFKSDLNAIGYSVKISDIGTIHGRKTGSTFTIEKVKQDA